MQIALCQPDPLEFVSGKDFEMLFSSPAGFMEAVQARKNREGVTKEDIEKDIVHAKELLYSTSIFLYPDAELRIGPLVETTLNNALRMSSVEAADVASAWDLLQQYPNLMYFDCRAENTRDALYELEIPRDAFYTLQS